MKRIKFLMPVVFLLISILFSAIVMLLWNWIMPAIFGLISINFWQALGLFLLARILFGSYGFVQNRMMHPHKKRNFVHEKWKEMTPEQREEFINKRRQYGFGHHFHKGHFEEFVRENPKETNE